MSAQTTGGSTGAVHATRPKTASRATDPGTQARSPLNKNRVLAVIGLSQLMVVLDTTIVNIALPSAQRSLGFSTDSRQWVVTAYALSFGSLLLVGGRLSDLLGRRRTLLIGLFGFALASALGGAAPNFGLLVAARALQGAFAAILAPAVLSTLNVTFQEGKERARAFGVYAAVAGGGGTLGLVLGGVLTQELSWRWCLYVNVFLVIPALFGVFRFVPASIDQHLSDRSDRGIDIPGVLTGPVGVFALVFGFSNAETHGWSAPLTIIMLAASVVLLSAFIVIESRVTHPLLPLQVLADRHRAGSYISIAIIFSGIFSAFLFISFFLQQNLHFSALRTGLAFLPMSAGLVAAVGAVNARLLPRFGPRPLVPIGMVLAGSSMFWLSQLTPSSTYGADVLGPLILLGMGGGLGFAPLISTATARIQPAIAGVGSAMINTSQQVGGSVGLSILSIVYASAVGRSVAANHNLAIASVHGSTVAFAASAGVFAVGAVISALMLRRVEANATHP
jgi:EmrB/QacA subfamily drug resistance transporter